MPPRAPSKYKRNSQFSYTVFGVTRVTPVQFRRLWPHAGPQNSSGTIVLYHTVFGVTRGIAVSFHIVWLHVGPHNTSEPTGLSQTVFGLTRVTLV
eukprot:242671-Pyramimonas_sp.AAC.1